jgi:hypothetical protein
MKKFTNMLVGVFCALLLGASTFAADTVSASTNAPVSVETVAVPVTPNAWVISLGGTGNTVTINDHDTTVGADISVGRTGTLLLPLEGGVRQGFSYDSTAVFSTKLYANWTLFSFATDRVDVFAGANAGATYGDIQTVWTAAPEAGLRLWVKQDVAVLLRAEFPFQLNDGAEFTDSVRYFLGFQVRW